MRPAGARNPPRPDQPSPAHRTGPASTARGGTDTTWAQGKLSEDGLGDAVELNLVAMNWLGSVEAQALAEVSGTTRMGEGLSVSRASSLSRSASVPHSKHVSFKLSEAPTDVVFDGVGAELERFP